MSQGRLIGICSSKFYRPAYAYIAIYRVIGSKRWQHRERSRVESHPPLGYLNLDNPDCFPDALEYQARQALGAAQATIYSSHEVHRCDGS